MDRALEPYLTIPELAKRGTIPLGETKLYELAKAGRIPCYRPPDCKKILVLESEVHGAIKKFNMRLVHGKAVLR